MVIDIGGQDSKVILTDGRGGVINFAMNDKCAAGTGRFLEVIAAALGADVSELAEKARGAEPVQISNMCTVFAESEVISLLAQGVDKGKIIAGIHRSVASRVAAMAERLGRGELIIFTGGVAKNEGVKEFLSRELRKDIVVAPESQLAGALGAALLAREKPVRKER
jgi:predicted CoA-substrate-specific enzyme activase